MALIRISKNSYFETSSLEGLEVRKDPETEENIVFCRVRSSENRELRGEEANALLTHFGIQVEI